MNKRAVTKSYRYLIVVSVLFLMPLFVMGCRTDSGVVEPEGGVPEMDDSESELFDEVSEEQVLLDLQEAKILEAEFKTDIGMGNIGDFLPDRSGTISLSLEDMMNIFSTYDYQRTIPHKTLGDGLEAGIILIELVDGTKTIAIAEVSVLESIVENWSKGTVLNYTIGNDGVFYVKESLSSEIVVYVEHIEEIKFDDVVVEWKATGLKP